MPNYKTITTGAEAEYEIQRSRFLTHTAHVETEQEAQDFIRTIKKKYFDARHNCSAWILGAKSSLQKSNDDGEPGGTAGNPILEALKKNELTDIVIVVTRYFGGIKLGAGGLIRAYGHAAVLGIEASTVVQAVLFRRTAVTMDYTLLGSAENLLRQKKIRIEDKVYAEKVKLILLLEKDTAENVLEAITDLTAGTAVLEELGETYVRLAPSSSAAEP